MKTMMTSTGLRFTAYSNMAGQVVFGAQMTPNGIFHEWRFSHEDAVHVVEVLASAITRPVRSAGGETAARAHLQRRR